MDRRIKIRHIESFVEIARESSLKKAAGKLGLTQPAISKTLKELEEILGSRLMERDRSGVRLTAAGEVFFHFAQMSFADLQRGFEEVKRVSSGAGDVLTIGSLPSVAASLMPKIVAEHSRLAPDTILKIIDGPHGYLIDRLKIGDVQMVIGRLGEPETMQGITFTQLYMEEVVFVVRSGHPMIDEPDLRRLKDWPVIYPREGAAIRPLVDRLLLGHGIGELPKRIETVSAGFGRAFTRNSDAVWIISEGVVSNELNDGHLVRLAIDASMTAGPVGLMTRPGLHTPTSLQIFELAVRNVLENSDEYAIPAE